MVRLLSQFYGRSIVLIIIRDTYDQPGHNTDNIAMMARWISLR